MYHSIYSCTVWTTEHRKWSFQMSMLSEEASRFWRSDHRRHPSAPASTAVCWNCLSRTIITTTLTLTTIFHNNLDMLVPECLNSWFYWSKDNLGVGNNWRYWMCIALVKSSPPGNQHCWLLIVTDRMPFLLPSQHNQITEQQLQLLVTSNTRSMLIILWGWFLNTVKTVIIS